MKQTLSILLMLLPVYLYGQQGANNIFDSHSDIGDPKLQGSSTYNSKTQEYFITASGTNIWNTSDEFHFLWKVMDGDFVAYARLKFAGDNKEPHRKAGWMFRQSLEANAPYADAIVHGDGLTSLQYRETIGGQTSEVKAGLTAPDIIQLVRKGDNFKMYACREGEVLTQVAEFTQPMGKSGYLGLAVCSHNEDVLQEMVFSNVIIYREVSADKANSREGATSRMEILDIESLNRMVIHQEEKVFEAPNWSAREAMLIYNREGSLLKIPVTGGTPVKVNTDFANRLNNDHGISPDGKWLAISHHREDAAGGGSTIYVLPYEGGKPKQVTQLAPSYWHGWSADSKTLAYVGERNNGNYDIYTISRNGGKEIRLTDAECLDDGPDYTADGQYIYFNSCRTGKMAIWRMKPDGSGQEQVTSGEYNDWFPHPSPDGKWLVFISYLPDVAPADHPPNKHVMLRLMPLAGGEIKVIAHLYGGQGTINVPSWSPDSKKLAFVSYTY